MRYEKRGLEYGEESWDGEGRFRRGSACRRG